MLYISIKLCKYKRLALSHIDYLEINPQNKIQLILGTNGSGKSSVLSQLTPLPASHQDYHKGGYKIVEILHNNSHYELKNLFEIDKNRFHFIKDGVELNDGLTASTFTELVRQEFKITADIQAMLCGNTVFHLMPIDKRRTWFTKISDSDFTYAIAYYNKLRERHRDMVGSIKMQQSRLVQESEKLLTPEMEETYRYEISLFQELLQHYLDLKSPIRVQRDVLQRQALDIETKMVGLTQSFRNAHRDFPNLEGFESGEAIDEAIITLRGRQTYLESEVSTTVEKIDQQDKVLATLKESEISSVTDIDITIDTLLQESKDLSSQIRLGLIFDDVDKAQQALNTVIDKLLFISSELVENVDRKYTRDTYIAALDVSKQLDTEFIQLQGLKNETALKRKELEHYKAHNQIECPKCKHAWFKGYSEDTYQATLRQETLLNEHEAILTAKIEAQNNLIQVIRGYLERYREYVQVSNAWSDLTPLWNYLSLNSIVFDQPKKIPTIIETLKGDLQVLLKQEQVKKRLSETLALKKTLVDNQEANVASFIQHTEELHEKLHNLNAELQQVRQQSSKLQSYKVTLKNMNAVTIELESLVRTRETLSSEMVNAVKMETLNSVIQQVHMELTDREQTIAKQDIQRAIIMNIQLNLKELTEKSELLKIAIDELSPTEGLIAKGLTGFINHFLAQMNHFIKKIWLYPMELVPIIPSEDNGVDLDYKFQVRINDDPDPSNLVPDISKGSAGMKEIIDLAFKVVNMMYLGLEKAPLVLDEFGARLDAAHRQSAQAGISNIINSSNFSQIFMVSHYENAYGSLTNADICVLHASNIKLPNDLAYNKHVKLH